jgi:hypothetical protein
VWSMCDEVQSTLLRRSSADHSCMYVLRQRALFCRSSDGALYAFRTRAEGHADESLLVRANLE